jgi:hypothetical protein
MADYDLLWSTMTRYHGGLGGGDGYTTELPDGFKENQSRIADKVPSRLKCPISGELVSASPTHAHHAASASFRRLSLQYCPLYCTVLYSLHCWYSGLLHAALSTLDSNVSHLGRVHLRVAFSSLASSHVSTNHAHSPGSVGSRHTRVTTVCP